MRAMDERSLAVDLLLAAASRCYWGNLREAGREVVLAADSLGPAADDQRLLFVQALAAPIDRATVVFGELERTARPDDAAGLSLRGMAVCVCGAFHQALPLLSVAAERLREQGRLPMLAQVQTIRAWAALEVGDFAVAIPAAEESARLWSESEAPSTAPVRHKGLAARAMIAALRGDTPAVETLTAEAERLAQPRGVALLLSLAQYARGLLELGQGRHDEAYEELRRIGEPGDPASHHATMCHSIGDFAEAAVRSGRRALAATRVGELEPLGQRASSPWFQVQLLLARVHLAAGDEAQEVFEDALSRDLTGWPLIRPRIELAYGEWLRRSRRRRESRAPLRAARDTFDALGVTAWAERARRELRASGEVSQRRQPDSLDELTPQELQIVQMAAQGLSNREIAQRLYLSHRTVESHLYRAFRKLGVTSRAQLVNALGSRLGSPS